jgi:hypothetical protein
MDMCSEALSSGAEDIQVEREDEESLRRSTFAISVSSPSSSLFAILTLRSLPKIFVSAETSSASTINPTLKLPSCPAIRTCVAKVSE